MRMPWMLYGLMLFVSLLAVCFALILQKFVGLILYDGNLDAFESLSEQQGMAIINAARNNLMLVGCRPILRTLMHIDGGVAIGS